VGVYEGGLQPVEESLKQRRSARKGCLVLITGYIDESYDNAKKLFALSCVLGESKTWLEMERKWKLHLSAKNKQLKKAGRPLISRYHATDCNGRYREFKGWTEAERNEFVLSLFRILKRTPLHTIAYDIDLDNLCDVFPEALGDRLELAYHLLIDFLIYTIGEDFHQLGSSRHLKIKLFHDRTADGRYDSVISNSFAQAVSKPGFAYAPYFTTIEPVTWKECIALQPADLVAFEMFREAQQKTKGFNSRKSFGALLNMESFGIHTKSFVGKETMLKLRILGEEHMRQREAGQEDKE